MVRELVHDPFLLARKSLPATPDDLDTARDLMDTLLYHKEGCVGMAANTASDLCIHHQSHPQPRVIFLCLHLFVLLELFLH